MTNKDKIGRIFDNSLISPAAGAALSFVSGPLGGVLSSLMNTVVAERQQERVDRTFLAIKTDLANLTHQVETLTEPQLKLVMETIRTVTETMNEEKLEYLINAVSNCVEKGCPSDYEAAVLGRLIRDISGDEIRLLNQASSTANGILTANRIGPHQEGFMVIIVSVLQDYDQIQSLVNMRLLEENADDNLRKAGTPYKLTSWAHKLLALVEPRKKQKD